MGALGAWSVRTLNDTDNDLSLQGKGDHLVGLSGSLRESDMAIRIQVVAIGTWSCSSEGLELGIFRISLHPTAWGWGLTQSTAESLID